MQFTRFSYKIFEGVGVGLVDNPNSIPLHVPLGVPFKITNESDEFVENQPLEWFDDGVGTQIISSEDMLEIRKSHKKQALQKAEDLSKLIKIIQHDIELVVKDRETFFKKIYQVHKIDKLSSSVVSYAQENDNQYCEFACVPYVWEYLFKDLFINIRSSGYAETLRESNKKEFIKKQSFIDRATSIAEIDNIQFDFIFPSGVVINVNDKAHQILIDVQNDITLSSEKKQEITSLINALRDESGNFNLIKIY